MKFKISFVYLMMAFLTTPSVNAYENPSSYSESAKRLQAFLTARCTDCHSADHKEGDILLDNYDSLSHQAKDEILNKIEQQVYLDQMPPEDEQQPTPKEREQFFSDVEVQFKSIGLKSKFRDKLKTPAYGNYVDHDKLFSGEFKHLKGFTYDRRWLISEYIFDEKINNILDLNSTFRVKLGGKLKQYKGAGSNNGRNFAKVNITNPFLLSNNTGVRYYANDHLNGGQMLTMISNAKEISAYMMSKKKIRSEYGPLYNFIKLQYEHEDELMRRKKFLNENIYEITQQLYKDNEAYFPEFVSLNIQKAPTHDENGKEIKYAGHDPSAPRNEYPAIKKAIRKYLVEGQSHEELTKLCEKEWFVCGVHESKISTRVTFMLNYMDEILRRNKITPLQYTPPEFKAEEIKLYFEMIKKYRNKGDHLNSVVDRCIQEWRQAFEQQRTALGDPDDESLRIFVSYLIERIYKKKACEEEIQNNVQLMRSYISALGIKDAMEQIIQTMILNSDFVYRFEFGEGQTDEHDRKMLSPKSLSYALSYALTDNGPDEELQKAAETNRLNTTEDIEREVKRMLARRDKWYLIDKRLTKDGADSLTNIPIRKLRFFREFFGYPNLLPIFKDEKRFGSGYKKSKAHLIDECDKLIAYILEKDQYVFEELLTTEDFYVYHSSDNEQMQLASDNLREQYEFFKDKDWKNFTWEEISKYKEFIVKNGMSHMHNEKHMGSFMSKMELLTNRFTQHKVNRSIPYGSPAATSLTNKKMGSPQVANFFNIKLDSWDYPTSQPAKMENRKGILTHPAWLIAHSQNTETDPVMRGKFVREKLLAGTVPDIPITVEAAIPENHHKTLRQRLVEVTEVKECWKCHKLMNPLGYTFEIYDDFGRHRKEESLEHPENLIKEGKPKGSVFEDLRNTYKTLPVDAKGRLTGTGEDQLDGDLIDAMDLTTRLGKSKRVRQSIIRHAFRYFMGRNELLSDCKTLIDADEAYVKSGGSFDAVIVSLLTSDSFIYRKEIKE